ncbi:Magnetosome protein Mad1 [Candidatus Desulfarcum epimagneticum]|uniref:Magnetosome protein Mad1 n=1 Tax=uncultured Desulfobacteraceae bacterium TaxID=218296 RepID=A0A484HIL0_9BACT|nr:Magnetosome protein Mad1 [uncultured Desulfobacteraceae bacterium]
MTPFVKAALFLLSGCVLIAVAAGALAANSALYPYFGFPSQGAPSLNLAAANVYYDNAVKSIIEKNCARCHSGPVRNLMDYDSLRAYADNGILKAMISPGGPMSRFAGNDAGVVLSWIDGGAPEKPPAPTPAAFWDFGFRPGPGAGRNIPCGPQGRKPFVTKLPLNKITYDNTIKFVVARDCLECHSGKFRNLTNYSALKFYVDNGLLQTLVSPGGEMHRFAGPDTRFFIAWMNNGAPK